MDVIYRESRAMNGKLDKATFKTGAIQNTFRMHHTKDKSILLVFRSCIIKRLVLGKEKILGAPPHSHSIKQQRKYSQKPVNKHKGI